MPQIMSKNELVMREYRGEAKNPETGEVIELFTSMGGSPIIMVKGEFVQWSWQELIEIAIKIVEEQDGGENANDKSGAGQEPN